MKQSLTVFCLLAILSFVVSPLVVSSSSLQVPVLTTTAGAGISAQISNYSLTGNQFCFSITNTSTSHLIEAIGFDLGNSVSATSFTQTGAGSFFLRNSFGFLIDFKTPAVSFALYPDIVQTKAAAIASQIFPGLTATFCLSANYPSLTAMQIAQSVIVSFTTSLQGATGFGCETSPGLEGTNSADIDLSFSSASQFCFSATNDFDSNEVITAIGFDVTDSLDPFSLHSIDPTPQPNLQKLDFTSDPGPIPQFQKLTFGLLEVEFSPNMLDFALVTEKKFAGGNARNGIRPGETSSEFCVNGDFSDDDRRLPIFVFVRYAGDVLFCPEHVEGSVGGGIIGSRPS